MIKCEVTLLPDRHCSVYFFLPGLKLSYFKITLLKFDSVDAFIMSNQFEWYRNYAFCKFKTSVLAEMKARVDALECIDKNQYEISFPEPEPLWDMT